MLIIFVLMTRVGLGISDFGGAWTWGDGNWTSDWPGQFDMIAIDGLFIPASSSYPSQWLGVGFDEPSGIQDGILERHFTRAAGDEQSYYLRIAMTAIGYPLTSHTGYLEVSTDDGMSWGRVASAVIADPCVATLISGGVHVGSSIDRVRIRYGIVDSGDNSTGYAEGGSRIMMLHYLWGVAHDVAIDGGSFIDDLSTLDHLYEMNQLAMAMPGYHPHAVLSQECYGFWRTGDMAAIGYRFDRPEPEGDATLIATIDFSVYMETVDEANYLATWYSHDGVHYTRCGITEHGPGSFYMVHSEVGMAGDDERLYVKIGGATGDGSGYWLGYVDEVTVGFREESPSLPRGDINGDGQVDMRDLAYLAQSWLERSLRPEW